MATSNKLLLTVLLLVSSVLSTPLEMVSDDDNDLVTAELEDLVNQHVERLKEFPCRLPQPVVMNASELLKGVSPHSVIFPHQSVVHRCGETSGCCKSPHQTCRVRAERNLTLVFKVVALGSERTFRAITVKDHVQCGCERIHRYHDD